MSKENLELARQLIEAVERRDLPRLIELTDPDVEWRSFFALGEEGGAYRGHSGVERYVGDLDDAWEFLRPEIDGSVAIGSLVLIAGRIHVRGRGSGAETKSPAAWLLKFRGGKLLWFRALGNPEQALEALGESQ